MTGVGKSPPLYANNAVLGKGTGIVRIAFGEKLDDVDHWHTSIILPEDLAVNIAKMILTQTATGTEQ